VEVTRQAIQIISENCFPIQLGYLIIAIKYVNMQ